MKATSNAELCFSDECEKQSFFINEIVKHQKLIRSVISRILTEREDIDDAVQECLLQAWASIDSLKNRDAPTAWLCAIARNTAFDVQRKKGRGTVSLYEPVSGHDPENDVVWSDILISHIPGPEEAAIKKINYAQFQQAYEMLPTQYRTQLYLRCYLEMDAAEIDGILGIDEHARRNACCRAKRAVRKNYEKLQAK